MDKLSGSQKDNTFKYNNQAGGNTPILSNSTNNTSDISKTQVSSGISAFSNANPFVPANPTIEGQNRNSSPGND